MVTQQLMAGDGLVIQEDYLRIKRLLDIILTLVALIPAGIVMLVTVIAIRMDSPGPVIFRQKRVGINGNEFNFYKFRSMYHNVDSHIHEEATARFIRGSVLNSADADIPYKLGVDWRVTRVGKFIRKTSIDELPQLWNVLKGDMSLVGPRPPLTYEVNLYTQHDLLRLSGKPGLTGTWQVYGRGRVTFAEMVEQDISYLQTQSLLYDVKLMALTLPVMIKGRGGV
jgi:lipopolysaccharide/colanic/teichoic acid biosynthesis glycosyltransferase